MKIGHINTNWIRNNPVASCWFNSDWEFKHKGMYSVVLSGKARGFGALPRNCKSLATLTPILPLPEELNQFRNKPDNDVVCLEGDGFLGITLRFDISDRKAIAVKTKSRQFSTLYKVECQGFKSVLNKLYNNPMKPLTIAGKAYTINEVMQTFKGSFNNKAFEITINSNEFGVDFSTTGNGYLKALCLHIFSILVLKPLEELPEEEKAKPFRTNFLSMNQYIYTGVNRLYIVGALENLFQKTVYTPEPSPLAPADGDEDNKGRVRPTVSVRVAVPSLETVTERVFTPFSTLPFSVNLFEVSRELTRDDSLGVSTLATNNFVFPTLSELTSVFDQSDLISHSLILESRLTTYSLVPADFMGPPSAITPLEFCFYEDSKNFERVFVQSSFLGACLYEVLLQHIQSLHSSRISYRSLLFESFEQKKWFNNGLVCRKTSLKSFQKVESQFELLTTGQNPINAINTNANLMFTSEFNDSVGSFYKTNRFITCGVFTSQNELADSAYKPLFKNLERALGETIILSDFPYVALKPCFERGNLINVSNTVYFRGLVSNAGSLSIGP